MLRCSGLFYACKNGAEARRFNPTHLGGQRRACAVPPVSTAVVASGGQAEPVIGRRLAPTRWLCPLHDLGDPGQAALFWSGPSNLFTLPSEVFRGAGLDRGRRFLLR
jgi:hypothetical protein